MILGVDPGKNGAFALLHDNGDFVSVHDMPSVGKLVSASQVADLMSSLGVGSGVTTVIEDVSSSPQMGVTSAFSFGRSKGIVEAVAASAGHRLVYVSPAMWKRNMKLSKDKGAAREMAMERWPEHRDLFKRVKDDGRAEAALIALWQIRHGAT